MKDTKKLAMLEGIVTLVTAGLLLFTVLFFFFFDASAIGAAQNPNADADTGDTLGFGIGKALQILFMAIGFIVVCVPTACLTILGSVQLGIHKKKGFSRVCTVLGLICKLVAAAAMFWNVLFIWQPWTTVFSRIWYVFILGTTVTSFAWSIAALVQRKKIAATPLKEVHSEEESKPDEILIYAEGEMPQIEEDDEQVVFYPEKTE